ncbi:MAG: glutamate 5-kinase, partial [Armatimonadetes bacterium RBG_16_58_9]
SELFSKSGIVLGQVLLTRDDFHHRTRYLNARNTIHTLLRLGCVPVVNENDTVATEEIRFGENDTLSALVAACVDADLLINLSDVDGLFDADPNSRSGCALIEQVVEITSQIEKLAGGVQGEFGSGGMRSKIEAAKIAVSSGTRMVIANAARPNVIADAANGKSVGTRFLGSPVGLTHRKRWIAFGSRVKGKVIINEGARKMLSQGGKSLLAAGIVGCDGSFEIGDLVSVVAEDSARVARGLVNYSAKEIELIRGKRSTEIEKILGYKDFDEVIHRDNLVLGV